MSLVGDALGKVGNFFDSVVGVVSKVFLALQKFFLQLTLVGTNLTEIILFIVLIGLLLLIFLAPARLMMWFKKFEKPMLRVWNWIRS